ncbi:MAG: imidazolonepropionase [Melioribacteraceae bacterium]|nr:imidazolonepropionase [Melioribacteraceae bacterium]
MRTILQNPSQIIMVDSNGKNRKRGNEMNELHILLEHSIIIEDGYIKDYIPANKKPKNIDETIDLRNKVVLPGIVECHTHTAFTGSRADEFRRKLNGESYESIAKSGGGINSTVESVRKATFEELVENIQPKINYFISQGVTTLEIKSGYGLSFYDEIKLLQVINHLNLKNKIDIIPTFLGAHTYPNEYRKDKKKYNEIIINEMLPYIAKNKLALFCDAFCESTAFDAATVNQIFEQARSLGLHIKLHTEQFNNIGGLKTALDNRAVSVDHLEVISENDIESLAVSNTVSVVLPGVSYFLNYDFAPARKLIESGATLALATDYNPGSSNIANISMIMSLAAIKMNMTIEEILSAYTINAAAALNLSSITGSLELNKKADLSVYECSEYPEIVYNAGKNINCITMKNGEIIYKNY